MTRRWPALAVAAAALVAPLLSACGDDDDDDTPADPTVTLFEGTINPNVSTGTS